MGNNKIRRKLDRLVGNTESGQNNPASSNWAFIRNPNGSICRCPENVDELRRLWLDRNVITRDTIGPGRPGDFDNGAWHISCHLIGAGGAMRAKDGRILWLEVSHDPTKDDYFASASIKTGTGISFMRLDSPEAGELLKEAKLLGYVEGSSIGHISAKGVSDPPTRFNGWDRKTFDQPVDKDKNGGKIWEHWCTTRDIRKTSKYGTSVLKAYIDLISYLGDGFIATIARGRRSYYHPEQLTAMVNAGLVSKTATLLDITPTAVDDASERLLYESIPEKALSVVERLDWNNPPRYYMFKRRIDQWRPLREMQ